MKNFGEGEGNVANTEVKFDAYNFSRRGFELLGADYNARARRSHRRRTWRGTGAIIGSTVGHAAAGALIGGPVGLIAGG